MFRFGILGLDRRINSSSHSALLSANSFRKTKRVPQPLPAHPAGTRAPSRSATTGATTAAAAHKTMPSPRGAAVEAAAVEGISPGRPGTRTPPTAGRRTVNRGARQGRRWRNRSQRFGDESPPKNVRREIIFLHMSYMVSKL